MCAGLIDYPIWIEHGEVSVKVDGPERLADAMDEFTHRHVGAVLKQPGVRIHPLAFMRVKSVQGGPPRQLCPFSFPADTWAELALEQVLMDTGGMQVRYLHNDRPWLEQPAIYTDVVSVVQEARSVADEWLKDKKKETK